MHKRIDMLREAFSRLFGSADHTRAARAPGRVNLIGEHTDYNEGYVLPIAIDRDAVVLFRPNGTSAVNVHSLNFSASVSFDLADPGPPAGAPWAVYPFGVAKVLQEHSGGSLAGIDAVVESTVPLGGGLSSSAAFEVAFALAFCKAAGIEVEPLALAGLCRRAENVHAGVNCGIMDQYVSLHARKDHAVFIDCRSLTHQLVPFRTDAVKLIVCDTGVRHSLAASEYNRRRAQCEEGVAFFARNIDRPIKSLRDLTVEDVTVFASQLESPVLERCRHVVTENARTLAAVAALRKKNMYQLGVLMGASHGSLRTDYQVTCRELDLMVDIAGEIDGVFGARMTGGGFGGCTISLVAEEHANDFCKTVAREYQAATGISPAINIVTAEAGAGIL